MKEYQLLDISRIADTVEGLFTKLLFQEHPTIICAFSRKLTGTKQLIRNAMLEIYMELNLTVSLRVET